MGYQKFYSPSLFMWHAIMSSNLLSVSLAEGQSFCILCKKSEPRGSSHTVSGIQECPVICCLLPVGKG